MAVKKHSVSFQPEIWDEMIRITGEEGSKVSSLVNAALVHYLTLKQGIAESAAWEAEHGAFTDEEITQADRLLDEAGVAPAPQLRRGRTHLR